MWASQYIESSWQTSRNSTQQLKANRKSTWNCALALKAISIFFWNFDVVWLVVAWCVLHGAGGGRQRCANRKSATHNSCLSLDACAGCRRLLHKTQRFAGEFYLFFSLFAVWSMSENTFHALAISSVAIIIDINNILKQSNGCERNFNARDERNILAFLRNVKWWRFAQCILKPGYPALRRRSLRCFLYSLSYTSIQCYSLAFTWTWSKENISWRQRNFQQQKINRQKSINLCFLFSSWCHQRGLSEIHIKMAFVFSFCPKHRYNI